MPAEPPAARAPHPSALLPGLGRGRARHDRRVAGLVAIVLLGLIGSIWVWRATTPPYLLFPHRAASRRRPAAAGRAGLGAAGAAHRRPRCPRCRTGAAAVDDYDDYDTDDEDDDLPLDDIEAADAGAHAPTVDEAVATVAQLRLGLEVPPRFLEGQVASAAILPFLAFIAPAIALAVVL